MIIGSRGLPARYGGFETFAEQLALHRKDPRVRYHVACRDVRQASGASTESRHFDCCGADCFFIDVPKIGAAGAIFYDLRALDYAIGLVREQRMEHPVFFVLGYTAGAFLKRYAKRVHALGGRIYVNPDGLEWKRSKWSLPIRLYLKFSERRAAKYADGILCDNPAIERYIQGTYKRYSPVCACIAYGTELEPSGLPIDDVAVRAWFGANGLREGEYYLVVGRFVPENNFETILREFMASSSARRLVIVSGIDDLSRLEKLKRRTGYDTDLRVCFPGAVYERALLKYIRENAFAYLHGHEVGGTNPSLLESLAAGTLCLPIDVAFNRETAGDAALYWTKAAGNLRGLVETCEQLSPDERAAFSTRARTLVRECYDWNHIAAAYESLFLAAPGTNQV
jgi:rhamnosyltransferase